MLINKTGQLEYRPWLEDPAQLPAQVRDGFTQS